MASPLALLLALPLGALAAASAPQPAPAADERRGEGDDFWEPRVAAVRAASWPAASEAAAASAAEEGEGGSPARRTWDRKYPSCLATAAGGVLARHRAKWWYSSYSPQDSMPDPNRTLTIAATVSLNQSNLFGSVGHQYLKAYDLFMHMLAKELGTLEINGRQHSVELIVLDDRSDAAHTEKVYQALTQCVSLLLLGPYSSTLTMPAAQVAQERGAMMVAPGASNSKVFTDRSNIFGTSMPGEMVLPAALEEVADHGAQTLSFVYEDATGTRSICSSVEGVWQGRGLRILGGRIISAANFGGVVKQLLLERPDVVVGCTYSDLCHALISELRRTNLNAKAFIFPICAPSPFFLERTSYDGQFMIGLRPRVRNLPLAPGRRPITAEEFTMRWKEHHVTEETPTFQALGAFVGISALILAVQYASTLEVGAVVAALNKLPEIRWNSNRQMVSSMDMVQYKFSAIDGQVVAPQERAEGKLWFPRPKWQDMICYDSRPQPHYLHRGVANSSERECVECPEGRVSAFVSGARACQECSPGEALRRVWQSGRLFDASCIACTPGTMGANGTCEFCPGGKFQSLSMQTVCHDCLAGRFSKNVASTACPSCEIAEGSSGSSSETFYNTQAGSTECFACPSGGLCARQADGLYSSITNKDAYYMLPKTLPGEQAKTYWCPHGDGRACLSRGRCHHDERGEPVMEGPMCGKCRRGYGRVHDPYGLCEKCQGMGSIVFSLLFHAFLMIGWVSFLLYMVFTTDFSNPRHLQVIIVRQSLNYIQMALIVTQIRSASTPVGLNRALKGIGYGSSEGGLSLFALSCLSWEVLPDVEFFKVAQIIGLAAVPCMLILLCGGYGLHWCAAALLQTRRPGWRRLVTVTIVVLYTATSWVTQWVLVSLLCHPYDVPRLVLDPSVQCRAPEHWKWQAASATGLALFSAGVPLAFYFVLLRYQRRGELNDPEVLQMLGFLSSGFEPRYWYFECVFKLREALFILIPRLPGLSSSDPQRNTNIQNTMLVVVSGLFLTLQLYCQPFDNRGSYTLDRIEDASLLAVMMTPLLQVVVWQGEGSEQWQSLGGELGATLCLVTTALLHCRVVVLVIFSLVRGRVIDRAPRLQRRSRWHKRLLGLFVPKGEAQLQEDGMDFHRVTGTCETLLAHIIEDIVRIHAQTGFMTYLGIASSLKDIVIEAQRFRDAEAERRLAQRGRWLRYMRSIVDRLWLGREAARGALSQLESILRPRPQQQDRRRVTTSSVRKAVTIREVHDERPLSKRSRPQYIPQASVLDLSRTSGQVYSIEELQEALMRLSDRPDGAFRVSGRSQASSHEDNGTASVSIRKTMDLRGFVDSEPWDEKSQALDAELRDVRQEGEAMRAALENELEENLRLRAALDKLKAELAELGAEAPADEDGEGEVAEAAAAPDSPGASAATPREGGEERGRCASSEESSDLADEGAGSATADTPPPVAAVAEGSVQDGAPSEPEQAESEADSEEEEAAAEIMQEKGFLAAECDNAALRLESLGAALQDSQLELQRLQEELAAGAEQAREAEARLAVAEAENASLHRWAEDVVKNGAREAGGGSGGADAGARGGADPALAESAPEDVVGSDPREAGGGGGGADAGASGGADPASVQSAPPQPPLPELPPQDASQPEQGPLRGAFLATCASKPLRGAFLDTCTSKVRHIII